jgi:hypothetical protein
MFLEEICWASSAALVEPKVGFTCVRGAVRDARTNRATTSTRLITRVRGSAARAPSPTRKNILTEEVGGGGTVDLNRVCS